ncbi:MAG: hypothetical protein HQL26_10255 [Candidatus Omnitrophica bacterium]|nr:hypothetical protein [Candidatus Omnitrophota bacterium]
MVDFNLWHESFLFGIFYFFIVLIPCVLITLLGRKLIYKLGHYPSRAPEFLVGIFWPFVSIMVFTFVLLVGFYRIFEV